MSLYEICKIGCYVIPALILIIIIIGVCFSEKLARYNPANAIFILVTILVFCLLAIHEANKFTMWFYRISGACGFLWLIVCCFAWIEKNEKKFQNETAMICFIAIALMCVVVAIMQGFYFAK